MEAVAQLVERQIVALEVSRVRAPSVSLNNNRNMISKIVHYCEFGETSNLNSQLNNWKRLLPGYIFIRWNEANFKLEDNPYAARAYAANRIDLLENYVRVWAIYNFGGISMDVRLELVKGFDSLLGLPYFIGLQNDNIVINPHIFGSTAGHEFFGKVLEYYNSLPEEDIDISLSDVMAHIVNTNYYYTYVDIPDMFVDCDKYITLFTNILFAPQIYDYRGILIKSTQNEYTISNTILDK